MASTIITKNSITASAVPVSGDLTRGELALNLTDGRIYSKDEGTTIVELGINPSTIAITAGTINNAVIGATTAVAGTFTNLTATGTLTGTLATDAQPNITSLGTIAALVAGTGQFSTSLNVDGTATMDGLTVDSSGTAALFTNGDGLTQLGKIVSDATYGLVLEGKSNNNLALRTKANSAGEGLYFLDTSDKKRMFIEGTTGDIRFYEDTGTTASLEWFAASTALKLTGREASRTSGAYAFEIDNSAQGSNVTAAGAFNVKSAFGNSLTVNGRGDVSLYDDAGAAKFFWDASAESLGIGTDSPATDLHIQNASEPAITLFHTGVMASQIGLDSTGSLTFGIDGATGATERMRIDSSGNVGIGVTSSSGSRLRLDNGGTAGAPQLMLTATGSGTQTELRHDTSGNLIFDYWNGGGVRTERMRIDSSGNLLVGKSGTAFGTAGVELRPTGGVWSTVTNGGSDFNRLGTDGAIQTFWKDGTAVGGISVTTSATAYNTSSDYRLKDITGSLQGSGAYIDSLNPVEGTWKADGSVFVGLIAHEADEVSRTPIATGEKDGEEMQGMSYSSSEMMANILAELQSLRKRVAELEV